MKFFFLSSIKSFCFPELFIKVIIMYLWSDMLYSIFSLNKHTMSNETILLNEIFFFYVSPPYQKYKCLISMTTNW